MCGCMCVCVFVCLYAYVMGTSSVRGSVYVCVCVGFVCVYISAGL